MNGRTAKRLRRLVRELKLDPETKYAPVGVLRRLPERTYVDRASGDTKVLPAGVLRRPFALAACERRAYQEAKALYKGIDTTSSESQTFAALPDPVRPFKHVVVDSMKLQPEGIQ